MNEQIRPNRRDDDKGIVKITDWRIVRAEKYKTIHIVGINDRDLEQRISSSVIGIDCDEYLARTIRRRIYQLLGDAGKVGTCSKVIEIWSRLNNSAIIDVTDEYKWGER
jgi:hypothetical protein